MSLRPVLLTFSDDSSYFCWHSGRLTSRGSVGTLVNSCASPCEASLCCCGLMFWRKRRRIGVSARVGGGDTWYIPLERLHLKAAQPQLATALFFSCCFLVVFVCKLFLLHCHFLKPLWRKHTLAREQISTKHLSSFPAASIMLRCSLFSDGTAN